MSLYALVVRFRTRLLSMPGMLLILTDSQSPFQDLGW